MMGTYVLLTRVSPEAVTKPGIREELCNEIESRVKEQRLPIRWVANYAVMGRVDYMDVFEAPDDVTAMKLSAIVRSYGHATTETWPAINWEQFVKVIHDL